MGVRKAGLSVALVCCVGLVACGDDAKPVVVKTSASGHIVLASGGNPAENIEWDHGNCVGVDGYDDVNEGATVTVKNDSGKIVGVGTLDAGEFVHRASDVPADCSFAFRVTGIPADSKFFTVSVSHRGEITVPKAELHSIALSLGEFPEGD